MKRFAYVLAAAVALLCFACDGVEGDLGTPSAGEPAVVEVETTPGASGSGFGTSKQAISSEAYAWFTYKCHNAHAPMAFAHGCFSGEAYCHCGGYNAFIYPCYLPGMYSAYAVCNNQ